MAKKTTKSVLHQHVDIKWAVIAALVIGLVITLFALTTERNLSNQSSAQGHGPYGGCLRGCNSTCKEENSIDKFFNLCVAKCAPKCANVTGPKQP